MLCLHPRVYRVSIGKTIAGSSKKTAAYACCCSCFDKMHYTTMEQTSWLPLSISTKRRPMPTATTSISMEVKSMAEAAAVTAAFVAFATRSGAMGRATVPPDNTVPDPASLQHTQTRGMLTPASVGTTRDLYAWLYVKLQNSTFSM